MYVLKFLLHVWMLKYASIPSGWWFHPIRKPIFQWDILIPGMDSMERNQVGVKPPSRFLGSQLSPA